MANVCNMDIKMYICECNKYINFDNVPLYQTNLQCVIKEKKEKKATTAMLKEKKKT